MDAGPQISNWHHLHFIEDHNAVSDVVKLSALGRPAGIKGFAAKPADSSAVPLKRSRMACTCLVAKMCAR